MPHNKDNGAIRIKAFRKLKPGATCVCYDYNTKRITCKNITEYPTDEELDTEVDAVVNEVIANEGRLENIDPYSLIYKNMWDGDYAGSADWQELRALDIDSGIYMIQLDAHTRFAGGHHDYEDKDGGQFACFIDGIEIVGALPEDSLLSGGCWTNVADLSETDRDHGGERNNGNQTLLIAIPTPTVLRFKGRTPDGDAGGIKMRMRTTVYKLGEV